MNHFSIISKFTNYEYEINVYVPDVAPPKEGFPIIYILDGGAYFPLAKQIVKLQLHNSKKTHIKNAIVVGICHSEATARTRRFYDFTAPAEEYHYPEHTKGKLDHIKQVGGAENFARFMREEVKREIEARYNVNKTKQILYGHSLSAYYVLWSYLTRPEDFQTHLAVSPSIWWNDRELFSYLENAPENELGSIYIIAGEKEGFMVEDAKQFYGKLPSHISKQLYIANDENHASVVPTTMSRAFRFCFEKMES